MKRKTVPLLMAGLFFISVLGGSLQARASELFFQPPGSLTGVDLNLRRVSSDDQNFSEEYFKRKPYWRHDLDSLYIQHRLKDYKVLLVPGFMSYAIPMLKAMLGGKKLFCTEYFELQRSLFDELGIDFEFLQTTTQKTMDFNSYQIRNAINLSKKPVIIVAHSKGGLDVTHALIKWPDLREKVAGFIPINSPYLGAVGADKIIQSKTKSKFVFWALKELAGDPQSLIELTSHERILYHRKHRDEMAKIAKEVPVLSFTSEGDGTVPARNARFFKASYVMESSEIGHKLPAVQCLGERKDQNRFGLSETALLMVLDFL